MTLKTRKFLKIADVKYRVLGTRGDGFVLQNTMWPTCYAGPAEMFMFFPYRSGSDRFQPYK